MTDRMVYLCEPKGKVFPPEIKVLLKQLAKQQAFRVCESVPKRQYVKLHWLSREDLKRSRFQDCVLAGEAGLQAFVQEESCSSLSASPKTGSEGCDSESSHPPPRIYLGYCECRSAALSDPGNSEVHEDRELDLRRGILDSSIWSRFVTCEPSDWQETMKTVLGDVWNYLETGLYAWPAAREFIDLQVRLCRESHLRCSVDNQQDHGHHVSPFHYHSEHVFSERVKNRSKTIRATQAEQGEALETYVRGIEWKVLWVDDQHVKKRGILDRHFDKAMPGNKIDMKGCSSLEEAKEQLEATRYDVILLDYLLGNSDSGSGREYGVNLLGILSGEGGAKYKPGPFGFFWVLPATAFFLAIHEHMQAANLPSYSDRLRVMRGADPVNTPHLFRSQLQDLLLMQSRELFGDEDAFGLKEDARNVWAKRHAKYSWLSARDQFLQPGDRYRAEENGSFLSSYMGQMNGDAYAHFLDLLYLAAYGSSLEWAEMQEELRTVEGILGCERDEESEGQKPPMERIVSGMLSELRRVVVRRWAATMGRDLE